MNPKVKAWMESNNFKWHDSLQIYYQPQNIRFGFVNPLHATFMYRQMMQAKTDAAVVIREFLAKANSDYYSHYAIEVCNIYIEANEAELKELEEEK